MDKSKRDKGIYFILLLFIFIFIAVLSNKGVAQTPHNNHPLQGITGFFLNTEQGPIPLFMAFVAVPQLSCLYYIYSLCFPTLLKELIST